MPRIRKIHQMLQRCWCEPAFPLRLAGPRQPIGAPFLDRLFSCTHLNRIDVSKASMYKCYRCTCNTIEAASREGSARWLTNPGVRRRFHAISVCSGLATFESQSAGRSACSCRPTSILFNLTPTTYTHNGTFISPF